MDIDTPDKSTGDYMTPADYNAFKEAINSKLDKDKLISVESSAAADNTFNAPKILELIAKESTLAFRKNLLAADNLFAMPLGIYSSNLSTFNTSYPEGQGGTLIVYSSYRIYASNSGRVFYSNENGTWLIFADRAWVEKYVKNALPDDINNGDVAQFKFKLDEYLDEHGVPIFDFAEDKTSSKKPFEVTALYMPNIDEGYLFRNEDGLIESTGVVPDGSGSSVNGGTETVTSNETVTIEHGFETVPKSVVCTLMNPEAGVSELSDILRIESITDNDFTVKNLNIGTEHWAFTWMALK